MSIALLYISDGRLAYSEQTLKSALQWLPKFDQYIFVDDAAHVLGFSGSVARGWAQVKTDFVFHLEQDFEFHAPVPVPDMVNLLTFRPYLAQVSMKRQAWNAEEKKAGGIVEVHPEWFTEVSEPNMPQRTEHRVYFTTNPSVYRADLCRMGWPLVKHSEGVFTHQLLRDPALRFAILGGKFQAPLVTHIGQDRVGTGY